MKFPKELTALLEAEIDPGFGIRAKYIFDKIAKIQPHKILDIGCGRGFYLYGCSFFDRIEEIHGVDANDKYLKIARKNCRDKRIRVKKANIYSLPYPDRHFDFIICSEVLEHLKNDDKGLWELNRVLKPEGFLLITVPNKNFPFLWDPLNWILMKVFKTHLDKNIWWIAGIWADHERLYDEREIRNRLQMHSFKILELHKLTNHCWPFSHFMFYAIGKNIIEKLKFTSFSRFNFENRGSFPRRLAQLATLPSRIWKDTGKDPSVNIALLTQK